MAETLQAYSSTRAHAAHPRKQTEFIAHGCRVYAHQFADPTKDESYLVHTCDSPDEACFLALALNTALGFGIRHH